MDISKILDYPNQRLFDRTLTSVSIFLYDKANGSSNVVYENVTDCIKREVARQSLGDKWVFSTSDNNCKKRKRFGDIFHASIAVATLHNKAFVMDNQYVDDTELEHLVIRNAVSPKTLHLKKKVKI